MFFPFVLNDRGDTPNLKILNGLEKNKDWPASADVVVFIDDSASQRGYGPGKHCTCIGTIKKS